MGWRCGLSGELVVRARPRGGELVSLAAHLVHDTFYIQFFCVSSIIDLLTSFGILLPLLASLRLSPALFAFILRLTPCGPLPLPLDLEALEKLLEQ